MTFRFLIDEVREVVSIGLEKMGHVEQEFDVLESPRKEFGDLTCNVAFKISKKIKAAPYAIAEDFTEKYLKPYLDQKEKKWYTFPYSVNRAASCRVYQFSVEFSNSGIIDSQGGSREKSNLRF